MARSHAHADADRPAEPQPVTPPPAPRSLMPTAMPSMSMVTDRNLLDQLRQIYQMAQRHKPVPTGTKLNEDLVDALSECADIAEKAVRG